VGIGEPERDERDAVAGIGGADRVGEVIPTRPARSVVVAEPCDEDAMSLAVGAARSLS
jgi:hypothetical protein